MKGNLLKIAERILFAGNILLLFFLLFESFIVLPVWFQSLGRIHPLILHFPIALLLLALLMEFFRFSPKYKGQEFYQSFTKNLFLFAAFTSLLTALMGLFLSLEEGYSGEVLDRHKWSGAVLVFFASILYSIRNRPWYRAKIARISTGLTAVTLILAAHFGATLTHGDDFILGPVLQARTVTVSFEDAQVFDHLILPILEKKCTSCHNAGKSKGDLLLTNKENFLKGGKTGVIFVGGNPAESLLFQRMHLPLDDEEHMPPSNKPQLTAEEKALIAQWIKSNLPFETRVASLPASDSLRMLAASFLNPASMEEIFDFPKADAETIKKLNNEYRVLTPVSRNSPALHVTLFSKANYISASLEELLEVGEQIVSLNLAKMPVTDAEMKTVAQFKNLNRLNLNFTEISGQGLEQLKSLKKLRHLSLSGTSVDYASLQSVMKDFSSLHSVTVWDTPITPAEVDNLRKEHVEISLVAGRVETAEDILQLNLPQLANSSNIFRESMVLELRHPIRDVEIRFSLDGTEPDRENSPEFIVGETVLKEGKLVKARAYKEGWLESEVSSFDVYQNRHLPDTVVLLSRLNRVHPANGPQTFFDGEMGKFNANSPAWANNWAGFFRNDMELLLEYDIPVSVSNIGMRILVEPSNVIFPPSSLEIWGGNDPNELKLIGKMNPKQPTQGGIPYIELISCDIKPFEGKFFKVVAKPVEKIPAWSKRKGGTALLLVDEMFVN
ncbi:MAG: putative CXXCH cytochrome family protein [Algoriphagus sp.]|jgi:predicted CXXCH cytochrome family protein